ncbi:MAG: rod shape-determining protein RodA [Acidimicrobiia bacterium]|nr:rod shape-determining protein RodA [Acidimicrobiia bacterium]
MVGVALPSAAARPPASATAPLRHVDWGLLALPVGISALGLLMVYSSTRTRLAGQGLSELYYVQRQGAAVVIGIAAMLAVMLVDYRRLRDMFPLLYVAVLPMLVGVLALGATRKGTQAWFQIGPLQFQPSELAKVVLVVALAGYCHSHRGDLDVWRFAIAIGLAGLPIVLVLRQPDLGTAIVLMICVGTVLVVAGARGRHLAVMVLLAVTLVGGAVSSDVFADYQIDRLTSFLDQSTVDTRTASDAEYNLAQSKTAIGAGGLTGAGLFEGTQTKLSYVPEQHTDFIFTVVGEELGFLGGSLLLALFAALVWRIWRIALLAADLFGTLLCVGMLAMFTFQVFENVGMTMGIMPITGIPLPFMSYGGSATIASFIAVGLVSNVHMRRFS